MFTEFVTAPLLKACHVNKVNVVALLQDCVKGEEGVLMMESHRVTEIKEVESRRWIWWFSSHWAGTRGRKVFFMTELYRATELVEFDRN